MQRFLPRKWLVASTAAAFTWYLWKNRRPDGPPAVICTSQTGPVHAVAHNDIPQRCAPHDHLGEAIERSRLLVKRTMLEQGIPGAVVAVSINGCTVWSEGLGYADVENNVLCSPDTVMRIASISKPLTAVALLQLWQRGLVDLDAPIQQYVPEFPRKEFNGKPVDITTRQLLCHLAGIRHYEKKVKDENEAEEKRKKAAFDHKEYYIKTHFKSVLESLRLFADDDLLSEPGKEFHYTSHGWTLISAVVEKVSGEPFLSHMKKHVFQPLGMSATRGEFHVPLVYNRARHYVRTKKCHLRNVPYVDNSYKWAGGGFTSTAEDLVRFGSAVLSCYQTGVSNGTAIRNDSPNKPAISRKMLLDSSTAVMMWTQAVADVKFGNDPPIGYGLGWLVQKEDAGVVGGKSRPFCVGHTGGAVGASSVLMIAPAAESNSDVIPQGIVVAVIFNLQEVGQMYSLGIKIVEEFL